MTTSDTDNMANSGQSAVKESVPVMPCQTAERGGSSEPAPHLIRGQLARGSTPSTRSRRRSEKRRMSELMFFRCTPEERAAIEVKASDVDLEASSYLRVQALGKSRIRKSRRIRADWDRLRLLLETINRAGNVVNQLVKYLYLGGKYSEEANGALAELRIAARAVVAAFDRG